MWAYLKDDVEGVYTGPVTCKDPSLTEAVLDDLIASDGSVLISKTPSGCFGLTVRNESTGDIIPPEDVSHEHGSKTVLLSSGVSDGDAVKVSYRTMVVSTDASESVGEYSSAKEARDAMLAAIEAIGSESFIRLGPSDLALKARDPVAFAARKKSVADKKNALLGQCYCCAQVESNGSISHLGSCWMDSV